MSSEHFTVVAEIYKSMNYVLEIEDAGTLASTTLNEMSRPTSTHMDGCWKTFGVEKHTFGVHLAICFYQRWLWCRKRESISAESLYTHTPNPTSGL
jgi:hypothetical protein